MSASAENPTLSVANTTEQNAAPTTSSSVSSSSSIHIPPYMEPYQAQGHAPYHGYTGPPFFLFPPSHRGSFQFNNWPGGFSSDSNPLSPMSTRQSIDETANFANLTGDTDFSAQSGSASSNTAQRGLNPSSNASNSTSMASQVVPLGMNSFQANQESESDHIGGEPRKSWQALTNASMLHAPGSQASGVLQGHESFPAHFPAPMIPNFSYYMDPFKASEHAMSHPFHPGLQQSVPGYHYNMQTNQSPKEFANDAEQSLESNSPYPSRSRSTRSSKSSTRDVGEEMSFSDDEELEMPTSARSDSSGASRGRGTGRKKIEIKHISNKLKRQITFSKRKSGLLKKVRELTTLTNTEALLVLVSETGNIHKYATYKFKNLIEGERESVVEKTLKQYEHVQEQRKETAKMKSE